MHICPEEIMMFMMGLPLIGHVIHKIRHKLKGESPCSKLEEEELCSLAQCDHSDEHSKVYDPLDP